MDSYKADCSIDRSIDSFFHSSSDWLIVRLVGCSIDWLLYLLDHFDLQYFSGFSFADWHSSSALPQKYSSIYPVIWSRKATLVSQPILTCHDCIYYTFSSVIFFVWSIIKSLCFFSVPVTIQNVDSYVDLTLDFCLNSGEISSLCIFTQRIFCKKEIPFFWSLRFLSIFFLDICVCWFYIFD